MAVKRTDAIQEIAEAIGLGEQNVHAISFEFRKGHLPVITVEVFEDENQS